MTDNTKMREALLKFGDENPSLDLDFRLHTHGKYLTQEKAIVASRAFKAGVAWQAAQSVPVVERNQCDGCNRGLQVCDDGLHREPSGHPVMACTRNKYTHSIPATELERLRKDVERYRWLRNYEKFNYRVHRAVQIGGNEMDEAIDAAMQERKE